MNPSLNYDKRDPKFILLGKIFKSIENKRARDIYSRNGIKKRGMMVICLKIIFITTFFDYELSYVVDEINRDTKLKKFIGIEDPVPTAGQIYEYMGRYSPSQYNNIFNSILKKFYNKKRRSRDSYIVDATPVACDINIVKKYVTPERLEELKLKMGYSTTKGYYIGFKVSMILDKESMCPIHVLIHPGSPNDARIFEEILEELKRRRLIKYHDHILFDRGYYSLKNYIIGIYEYKIVPIIFPRSSYNKDKILNEMNYPLDVYHKTKHAIKLKTEIEILSKELIKELDNWKDLKPIRGLIEDFFKAAKGAFGLGEFHSYTEKSMQKNIYLCLLLTALVVQTGFKTKTKLQQLAEGIIDGRPPKKKNKKKKEDKTKNHHKTVAPFKKEQKELSFTVKEQQKTLEFFL